MSLAFEQAAFLGSSGTDDLRTLGNRDRRLVSRIMDAIERYAGDDRGDVRKLSGNADEYRLRVGDWHVVFRLQDGGRIMAISRVLNRRDAYR